MTKLHQLSELFGGKVLSILGLVIACFIVISGFWYQQQQVVGVVKSESVLLQERLVTMTAASISATVKQITQKVELAANTAGLALALRDSNSIESQQNKLQAFFPDALSACLIRAEVDQPDLGACVPINFGVLSLLREAKSDSNKTPFAVTKLIDEKRMLAVAHQIADEKGKVVGVLLVAFAPEEVVAILPKLGSSGGFLALQQGGDKKTDLGSQGDLRWKKSEPALSQALPGTIWNLAYWPSKQENTYSFWGIILAVLLPLILLWLWRDFWRDFMLQQDIKIVGEQLKDLQEGRLKQDYSVGEKPIKGLVLTILGLASLSVKSEHQTTAETIHVSEDMEEGRLEKMEVNESLDSPGMEVEFEPIVDAESLPDTPAEVEIIPDQESSIEMSDPSDEVELADESSVIEGKVSQEENSIDFYSTDDLVEVEKNEIEIESSAPEAGLNLDEVVESKDDLDAAINLELPPIVEETEVEIESPAPEAGLNLDEVVESKDDLDAAIDLELSTIVEETEVEIESPAPEVDLSLNDIVDSKDDLDAAIDLELSTIVEETESPVPDVDFTLTDAVDSKDDLDAAIDLELSTIVEETEVEIESPVPEVDLSLNDIVDSKDDLDAAIDLELSTVVAAGEPSADKESWLGVLSKGSIAALDPNIFRMYDIRGVVGDTITGESMALLGLALGRRLRARSRRGSDKMQFVVGRDGRLSSKELTQALIEGVLFSGCDVVDIGEVPTPVLYFAVENTPSKSGLMVTGSHNESAYNGLKMVIGGETLSSQAIQDLSTARTSEEAIAERGKLTQGEFVAGYLEELVENITLGRPIKVVVDAGNGVAGPVIVSLLEKMGCDVIPLYCEVDGHFPHHHPNPSEPDNLQDLIAEVRSHKAELGLAFDGDGDRLGVIDDLGNIIWADKLLGLYAQEVLKSRPGEAIVYDVKSSSYLKETIESKGGQAVMVASGYPLIKKAMREHTAPLAGEMSGHIFFKDRWYGFDDALYAACRLLEVIAKAKVETKVSALFAALPSAKESTPELLAPMKEGEAIKAMEKFGKQAIFIGGTISKIDGVRVEYADGWGLARASHTSPCIVLRFEADNEAALKRIQAQFKRQLLLVSPTLDLPI